MTLKNKLKLNVSPIIYNNGNRKLTLKINNREVYFMQKDLIINDDLKKLLLSDKEITKYFLIALLHNVYKTDDPKEHEQYYFNEFTAYDSLINNDNNVIDNKHLKASLLDVFNDMISNDMINETIQDYTDLGVDEGKQVIYTLSRLLYIQNKYKNDDIGEKIDIKIKEWLDYIRKWDEEKDTTYNNAQEAKSTYYKTYARLLFRIIPSLTYEIYYNDKTRLNYNPRRPFMDLWDYNVVKMTDLHEFILTFIKNRVSDSRAYNNINEVINDYINNLENDININMFKADKKDLIDKIRAKYNVKLDKELNYNIPNETQEAFLDEISNACLDYKKTNGFNIQDNEDVKKWRDKADKYINHLITYKDKVKLDYFNMDYTLNHLAYSDYQKKAYKLNISDDGNVKEQRENKEKTRRLNAKELKEKYKDITLLNGEKLDYNRKWARVDTSKINNNIIDLRESITKRTQNNTDITRRKIAQIEKKTKPSKEDLNDLKELKALLNEQIKEQEGIINEIKELKADIDLLNKQISDTTEAKQIKALTRKRNKIQKQLTEKEAILRNEGIYLQADLFSDKLVVAEKVNKKTKESYKLMINNDYDIQNFNSEGRNFLYYIPNIPNIIDELNEDFITLDITDYLDFTGRPTGNVSRIRKNLQNTLKEMRKESYDYTYLDDKGVLHDDSLVLIGDIKGTEYKGKASVKVQLGATFKDNLKQAFIKSQYVKVNSDVFKIGQGRNNKAENMAKEIFLYLAKLCRTEAKNQLNGGKWRKDVHLDTIITKLCDLNLITYNPYRYNESVKEPLLYALNTGVELGYFTYNTDAFSYYDDVIASNNRGANVQDKITNFEKGKQYGIKFIINGDMVDLENNVKAHNTYNKYKNKHKATKNK